MPYVKDLKNDIDYLVEQLEIGDIDSIVYMALSIQKQIKILKDDLETNDKS